MHDTTPSPRPAPPDCRLVVAFFGIIFLACRVDRYLGFFFLRRSSPIHERNPGSEMTAIFPSSRYRIAFLDFPGEPSIRVSRLSISSFIPGAPIFSSPFRTRIQTTNVGRHPLSGDRGESRYKERPRRVAPRAHSFTYKQGTDMCASDGR